MIEIPLDKALVAVEAAEEKMIPEKCAECSPYRMAYNFCSIVACRPHRRKDGKNVIFKLIDLPSKTPFCPKCGKNLTDNSDELLKKYGSLTEMLELEAADGIQS